MESMTAWENARSLPSKSPVTIKGVRDGLLFLLQENVAFEDILQDLENKLKGSHQKLLVGPIVHVWIVIGKRVLTEEQEQQIRNCFSSHGNLIIQKFVTEEETKESAHSTPLVYKGTVRSGQILQHEGDIIIIGDVNYGGEVAATGDIFVMGTLRGTAHAGIKGNRKAIIAAVYFRPTQLRICEVISRSPDTNQQTIYGSTEMEFAYLRDGQMAVDRMTYLNLIRNKESK
ncbi:septum site-determining protein MinC [Fodinisporobacter ferrooxydans]|uniref:Probable septum site-determining protein MinC n=1 Tax=Fodinisporobacter ferrooxydans TaxID=2901836 RepID=A0ABY4CJG6_9BACL|nr:septum site-determining protein MinC [Alicyclobacillaceae bacterium MYW30-H2]